MRKTPLFAALAALVLSFIPPAFGDPSVTLLNVSYDPTRELWRDINEQLHPALREGDRARS